MAHTRPLMFTARAISRADSLRPDLWPDRAWIPGYPYPLAGTIPLRGNGSKTNEGMIVSSHATAFGSSTVPLLNLSTSGGMTLVMHIRNLSGGTQPGIVRSGPNANGSNWICLQTTTLRPWVRLNGIDVLKPTSGTTITAGSTLRFACAISTSRVTTAWNGAIQYKTSGNYGFANEAFYRIGTQNGVYSLNGEYLWLALYNHPLTEAQLAAVTTDPAAPLQRKHSLSPGSISPNKFSVINDGISPLFASVLLR